MHFKNNLSSNLSGIIFRCSCIAVATYYLPTSISLLTQARNQGIQMNPLFWPLATVNTFNTICDWNLETVPNHTITEIHSIAKL